MFLLGGSFAMVIRAELFQPGLQIVEPAFFNQMTTMHGLIMVFGAVMPAFVGLANWMIPLMIGAPDMALPRMNNFSFWLLPAAFFNAGLDAFYGRRRAEFWVDVLCAFIHHLRTRKRDLFYFCHPFDGH